MQFGSIPLDQALGAILAHSTRTTSGMLKKGRVLSGADLQALRRDAVTSVIAAKLEPSDVPEDQAAQRIAGITAGSHTRSGEPFTGRANLFATAAGIVVLDSAGITQLNAADERVTLATLANYERVAAGQMVATVKIIPFAVPDAVISRVEAEVAPGLVRVAPYVPHQVGLILTTFSSTKAQVLDRRRDAVVQRVQSLGSTVTAMVEVAHTTAAVCAAIRELAERKLSPILIFAASAIVDRADVIPAGLVAAGGSIIRLGMPVDPGNLLLWGRLDTTPVIGLPSCAASLKLNGFDWVLERTLAGVPVSLHDIAAMGQGGLLKEIDTRPQPRLGPDAKVAATHGRHAPQIAALVLAAGRSTRMGPDNKLLADVAGTKIVRRVVEAALQSTARPVRVVVGHQSENVRAALAGLDVSFVENPRFADGLSSSLRAGLESLPPACDGAVVMLGDMPEIAHDLIDRLIAAFDPADGRGIVVPTTGVKRGNPVLWAREFFGAMSTVTGDTGAKHLLGQFADAVVEITADAAVHTDIDTPDALAALRKRFDSA